MFELEKYHAQQPTKVIMHKSRNEVSLVEQNTIEYVPLAYLIFFVKLSRNSLILFFSFILCIFIVRTLQYLKKCFSHDIYLFYLCLFLGKTQIML